MTPPKNKYDVLVAGGGPAGLSAAYAAALGGLRVALCERSKEIGYPIHTSGGSWLPEMRRLDIPERFLHPIHIGRFLSPAAEATFTYGDPVSCVLDVRGLYQYLARLAIKAGAEIFPATRVERVIVENGKPSGLQITRGQKVLAPLLIDATGMAGLLAKQMGLRESPRRYGVGAECDIVTNDWPADTVALLFGGLAGPAGYGWIFPHGEDRVRIGVGLIQPDTRTAPEQALQALLANVRRGAIHGVHVKSVSALEYHTGTVPATPPLQRTSAHGLLVVGDAAGLISTLLGEGIRFAIELGRLAGEMAVEAHRANRFDSRFLARYDKAWQARYGRLFKQAAFINRHIAGYDDHAWNEKIKALSHFPAHAIPPLLKGEWSNKVLLKALWQQRHHFKKSTLRKLAGAFAVHLLVGAKNSGETS